MDLDRLTHLTKAGIFARVPTNDEQLSLAPAAGAGVGKLLAESLLADPDFMPSMKAAVMNGLKAQRSWWDRVQNKSVSEPDGRVQIQTLSLMLAHMEGEPVKRIIHQHIGGEGGVDVLGALRDSPALQSAMERALEKARFRERPGRGRKAEKTVDAVEVDFEAEK